MINIVYAWSLNPTTRVFLPMGMSDCSGSSDEETLDWNSAWGIPLEDYSDIFELDTKAMSYKGELSYIHPFDLARRHSLDVFSKAKRKCIIDDLGLSEMIRATRLYHSLDSDYTVVDRWDMDDKIEELRMIKLAKGIDLCY